MKTSARKTMAFLAAALLLAAFCLPAWGEEPAEEIVFDGTKYIYEGDRISLKKDDLPEDYLLVPYEQFEAAFKAIAVEKTVTTDTVYADIAALFGDDGLKVAGLVINGYAYYTWYSDKDAPGGKVVSVAITFKDNGEKLTYYAYSSDTITPKDFE